MVLPRVTLAPAGWLTTLHWPRPGKLLFARFAIPACKVADEVGSSILACVVPLGGPKTSPYGAAILNPVWPRTGGGLAAYKPRYTRFEDVFTPSDTFKLKT